MKLAVSNIAWDEPEQDAILAALAAQGVAGIEIAPTKLWPDWLGADVAAAAAIRERMTEAGFHIPALQSVLFGRPELQLFGGPDIQRDLVAHLDLVAGLAGALGASAIVFGSPRNRDRGDLGHAEAMERAVGILRRIGDAFATAGCCLCLEPNPSVYACNFLTRWHDAAELAARVDHPGIGLHLDTACIHLAGDDPVEAVTTCATTMRHFHISEPQLGGFTTPAIDHARIGRALRGSGYTGWLSIEMRRQSDPVASVLEAVTHAKACYA
jgi:D-psicose/D-tagatose/L-ribulose 3-epimerase